MSRFSFGAVARSVLEKFRNLGAVAAVATIAATSVSMSYAQAADLPRVQPTIDAQKFVPASCDELTYLPDGIRRWYVSDSCYAPKPKDCPAVHVRGITYQPNCGSSYSPQPETPYAPPTVTPPAPPAPPEHHHHHPKPQGTSELCNQCGYTDLSKLAIGVKSPVTVGVKTGVLDSALASGETLSGWAIAHGDGTYTFSRNIARAISSAEKGNSTVAGKVSFGYSIANLGLTFDQKTVAEVKALPQNQPTLVTATLAGVTGKPQQDALGYFTVSGGTVTFTPTKANPGHVVAHELKSLGDTVGVVTKTTKASKPATDAAQATASARPQNPAGKQHGAKYGHDTAASGAVAASGETGGWHSRRDNRASAAGQSSDASQQTRATAQEHQSLWGGFMHDVLGARSAASAAVGQTTASFGSYGKHQHNGNTVSTSVATATPASSGVAVSRGPNGKEGTAVSGVSVTGVSAAVSGSGVHGGMFGGGYGRGTDGGKQDKGGDSRGERGFNGKAGGDNGKAGMGTPSTAANSNSVSPSRPGATASAGNASAKGGPNGR